MNKNKQKRNGLEAFEEFYQSQYNDRWPKLKEALLTANEKKLSPEGLVSPYYMDEASLTVASLLPLKSGDKVLDMCAAPGGKSLVLATRLHSGILIANDRSPERRVRMKKVFSNCLSEKNLIINVTGYNAESWGLYEKNEYDAILLDSPCSSERHVINDIKYLQEWSPSRPKRLAIAQYAMLSSALIALKEKGHILYSTCSINNGENEAIIDKLLSRHNDEIEIIKPPCNRGEELKYGRIILPDKNDGIGPMYFALIKKKETV